MRGEHFFFWNSIPNLLTTFGLVVYLSRRKSVGAVMAAMFVYLSIHNGYAIFAAATGDGINTMNKLHYERSDPGAKLVGAVFLVYCTILIWLRLDKPVELLRSYSKIIIRSLLLFSIFSLFTVYGAANLPGATASNFLDILKESAFAVAMWLVAMVFFVVMKQGVGYFISRRSEWSAALVTLALIMVISGLYEIGSGMVWAGTNYATGFSYRASATLFNPNVLGLWCALMVTLVAMLFHIGWISRAMTLFSMLVIMGSLALSSSRSGLMLSIISLFTVYVSLTLSKKTTRLGFLERFFPAGSFLLSLFLYIICIRLVTPSAYSILNTISANLLRFTQLPGDIFWIFMTRLILPGIEKYILPAAEKIVKLLPASASSSDGEITQRGIAVINIIKGSANAHSAGKLMESVDGRTLLKYVSDNSYMALFAVGGIVPLLIWLGLWGALFWTCLKKYGGTPGILSSYALTGVVLCFSSGFFLRAPQLFPTWIFLSMVLGACLYWCASSSDDPYSRHPKHLT